MKDCLDNGQGILFHTLQSLCGLNQEFKEPVPEALYHQHCKQSYGIHCCIYCYNVAETVFTPSPLGFLEDKEENFAQFLGLDFLVGFLCYYFVGCESLGPSFTYTKEIIRVPGSSGGYFRVLSAIPLVFSTSGVSVLNYSLLLTAHFQFYDIFGHVSKTYFY